jgi:hypothetical protein
VFLDFLVLGAAAFSTQETSHQKPGWSFGHSQSMGGIMRVTGWLMARKHINRGNIFGNFELDKEYFDRIALTTVTA